jgi:hypothetical protein
MAPEERMHLFEIREIVKQRWTFTPDKYPDLHDLRIEGARRFERGHILKHMLKSLGKIAENEEARDHGSITFDLKDKMRPLIGKMLVNLMQLAESYGISDEELERFIREEGA